jgi:hypothetical protein
MRRVTGTLTAVGALLWGIPGARGASPLVSVRHPAATKPPAACQQSEGPPFYTVLLPELLSTVWTDGERAVLYSRRVNQLTCALRAPGVDWLGTRAGIKRVDTRRGIVRHYTEADGLPAGSVAALARRDDGELWCAVRAFAGSASQVFLCRLDAARNVWITVHTVPLPDSGVLEVMLRFSGPRFLGVALNLAGTQSRGVFGVYDTRGANRWREIASFPTQVLRNEITLVLPDEPGRFWVGTRRGLFRCGGETGAPREPFFPGSAVWGGATAPDRRLWLALTPAEARDNDNARPELVGWDPRTNTSQAWALPANIDAGLFYAEPSRLQVVWADGAAWLAKGRGAFFSNTDDAAGFGFDPAAGAWRNGGFPDEVLISQITVWDAHWAQPTTAARRALLRRFPAWTCPAEAPPLPPPAVETRFFAFRSLSTFEGAPSAMFSLTHPQDQTTLVFRRVVGSGEAAPGTTLPPGEVVPFPDISPVRVSRPQAVAIAGGTLVVAEGGRLWRRGPQDGTWRGDELPIRSNESPSPVSLHVEPGDGGGVWVGQGNSPTVLRWNPQTGGCRVAYQSRTGGVTVLGGLPSGDLLVRDGETRVVRVPVDAPEEVQTEAAAPAPPGLRDPKAFAVTGALLWYEARPRGGTYGTHLLAFDRERRSWTPDVALLDAQAAPSVRQERDGGVYFATGDREAAVRRYDPAARRWEIVAPAPPLLPGSGPPRLGLASADARDLWLVDTSRATLHHWDRRARRWAQFRAPKDYQGDGSQVITQAAVRRGNLLLVATAQGLWNFAIDRGVWTRQTLPPAPRTFTPRGSASDPRAVWVIFEEAMSGEQVAGRWDRAARRWTLWDQTRGGFPAHAQIQRLVADGDGAWAIGMREAFHVTGENDSWENVSARVGGGGGGDPAPPPVYVADVVPDGASVWIVTAHQWGSDMGESPLACYDRASRAFTRIVPEPLPATPLVASLPPPPPHAGLALLVDGNTLWLATDRGVFRRERRARPDAPWRRLEVARTLPLPVFTRIVRADDLVWFLSDNDALRWSEPAR